MLPSAIGGPASGVVEGEVMHALLAHIGEIHRRFKLL
jgi:hypothetical protein